MRNALRRLCTAAIVAAMMMMLMASPALAGQLPDNCTKVKGTVTCTTFDGPGKNQAGVGTTTIDETQGNTTNISPEPQDLESSETCKPPTSKGTPCNP